MEEPTLFEFDYFTPCLSLSDHYNNLYDSNHYFIIMSIQKHEENIYEKGKKRIYGKAKVWSTLEKKLSIKTVHLGEKGFYIFITGAGPNSYRSTKKLYLKNK